jgi:hypothetical protein
MNKSEIVEAINSTIVSNGQKGISAESLNLILNEMVNVTEDVVEEEKPNVGDGALRILVPDDTSFGPMFLNTTAYMGSDIPEGFTPGLFSQSNYEILKQFTLSEINSGLESGDEFNAMLYQMYLDFFNTLDIKIPEMFAHNAEVYNILMDKLENGEGAYLLIDQSLLATEFLKMELNIMGSDAGMGNIGEDARMSTSQPAMFSGMKAFIFQEELGSESVIMFSSMHSTIPGFFSSGSDSTYQAGNMFMLLPDGSITNQDMVIGDYIYVPKSDGVLTDQQKHYNSNIRTNPIAQNQLKYIRLIDSEGDTEDYADSYNVGPRILQASENTFTYLEGLDYKEVQIDGSGNVTVTILGSLVASGSTTETTN